MTSRWDDETFRVFYDKQFGPKCRTPAKERFFSLRSRIPLPMQEMKEGEKLPEGDKMGPEFAMGGAKLQFYRYGERISLSHASAFDPTSQTSVPNEGIGLDLLLIVYYEGSGGPHQFPVEQCALPELSDELLSRPNPVRVRVAPRSLPIQTMVGDLTTMRHLSNGRVDLLLSVLLLDIFKIVDFTLPPVLCAPGDVTVSYRLENEGFHNLYISRQLLIAQSPVLAEFFKKNPDETVICFENDRDTLAGYYVIGLFIDDEERVPVNLIPAVTKICRQLGFTKGVRACEKNLKRALFIRKEADRDSRHRGSHLLPLGGADFKQWTVDNCIEGAFVQQFSLVKRTEDVVPMYEYMREVGWSEHMMGLFYDQAIEVMTSGPLRKRGRF